MHATVSYCVCLCSYYILVCGLASFMLFSIQRGRVSLNLIIRTDGLLGLLASALAHSPRYVGTTQIQLPVVSHMHNIPSPPFLCVTRCWLDPALSPALFRTAAAASVVSVLHVTKRSTCCRLLHIVYKDGQWIGCDKWKPISQWADARNYGFTRFMTSIYKTNRQSVLLCRFLDCPLLAAITQ